MTRSHKPPELPFERLDIDHATNNAPPPRGQRSARQDGPAYWWNAATQELIEIPPEDHPDYEQYERRITATIRRWNKGTSR
jgi:hypothetical protein